MHALISAPPPPLLCDRQVTHQVWCYLGMYGVCVRVYVECVSLDPTDEISLGRPTRRLLSRRSQQSRNMLLQVDCCSVEITRPKFELQFRIQTHTAYSLDTRDCRNLPVRIASNIMLYPSAVDMQDILEKQHGISKVS